MIGESISAALETVYNPRSSNGDRLEAQKFLETVKAREDSALIGYELQKTTNGGVIEPQPNGYIRHFGLTLIEVAIKFSFDSFNDEKKMAVQDWVIKLAYDVNDQDPRFIREKIAFLVVSLAKRLWGIHANGNCQWVELDMQLRELYTKDATHMELVLSVLRTLFEDVYLLDDPMAATRMNALSTQCIEIVSSVSDLTELYAARSPDLERLRSTPDGWLRTWTLECQNAAVQDEKLYLRLMETIKSTLEWVPIVTAMNSEVLKVLIQAGNSPNVRIRIIACDCLHTLFHSRTYTSQATFSNVLGTIFQADGISWLNQVYESAKECDPMTDEYMFLKKFVELIVYLGEFVEHDRFTLPEDSNLKGYFQVMLKISEHPSLMISGLVLQFWCSILRIERLARLEAVEELFPALLEVASSRCISYEDMPEDSISKQYMLVDFDAKQESVQFYRSYQRYMEDILRLMVCRIPVEGMQFIRNKVMQYFQSEIGWKTMNEKLEKDDAAYIYGSSMFVLVESTIRGASRWQLWAEESDKQRLNNDILLFLSEWALEMLELRTVDLRMQRKTVECLVQFAPLLKDNDDVLFKILERVLQSCTADLPPETPEFDAQREAVMELRMASGTELNRLAYMVPEALSKIYEQLEQVVAQLIVEKNIKEHESVSFKSFLLVASQRSDMPNRDQKFITIVDPVLARWTDETTMKGLTNLEWFLERVGVVEIDQYFKYRGITEHSNLLEIEIDDAGRKLKAELKQKWQQIFPIRPSRIFIQYTIERLDHNSKEYQYLLSMWKPRVQPILPHILQLISQIMAYHNPANWTSLPPEVQTFVKASCTERFWQVGISMQTRAEFEQASQQASQTLQDFADSVGHIVRYTREYAFLTLGSISQLEETMYEIPGMGRLLATALTSTTEGVTCHAWRHMISLVVRNIIKNCPPQYIEPFFLDFLPPFLQTMNQVLVNLWTKQEKVGLQMEDNDKTSDDTDLSEEMMDEYLLRQLTAITDRLLIDLVGQSSAKNNLQPGAATGDSASANAEASDIRKQQIRKVCRNSLPILVEILKLCKNLMIFKDSRCCFNTCLIIRHLLAGPPVTIMEEVSPFIITEIMPSCLEVLSQKFFSESHLEVGTILTLIYAQLPSTNPTPLQQLRLLLPNVPDEKFQKFQMDMSECSSLRQQRGIFMEFLTQCRVLEVDDQSRARNKRRVEQRVSVRNIPEEHYDSEALISMFNI
ncbi:karyopherin [Starmerella bacillaris]|uniref:Karyopherin n=1 Tax=Starmerella bacillaris TaxID=1247836 RepID=A0AAV5RNY5_STABA|nr:karyopherin [Starmerella bacillaris]